LCVAHFVGPFFEGMGCLAPSRRYLGDVVFWRKGDTDFGPWPVFANVSVMLRRRLLLDRLVRAR